VNNQHFYTKNYNVAKVVIIHKTMKANLAPNKKKKFKKKEKKQTYALFARLLDLTTEFDDMLKNSEIW
jgi:predicted GIY-YIG superfamily endonuclease